MTPRRSCSKYRHTRQACPAIKHKTPSTETLTISVPETLGEAPINELCRLLRWYDANLFAVRDEIVPRITAKALYLSASLFNHSCAPNCVATFEGDCVSIRAIENISDGD